VLAGSLGDWGAEVAAIGIVLMPSTILQYVVWWLVILYEAEKEFIIRE
jgi:hypothetical protein